MKNDKAHFSVFFHQQIIFFIKAKLTVSKSLSSTWCYFFDSTHLKGFRFFSSIFQPKGEPQDLDEPCFPYTFYPSFIPSIGFWRYSSKNLNSFLAHCEGPRNGFQLGSNSHDSQIANLLLVLPKIHSCQVGKFLADQKNVKSTVL